MKYLKAAYVSAMFGFLTSAFAGAGVVTTTVTSLQNNVTYARAATTKPAAPALVTYIGYTVKIANAGGNTINNIRFTGTTSVTDSAEQSVFSSVEGGSCVTTNASRTAIECSIGQLTAGKFTEFAVFFLAPQKVTQVLPVAPVADADGEDKVSFSGLVYYAEGTGGINSIPDNSINDWSAGLVTLGTFNPERIKSAVPKSGGDLFTGDGGVTTPNDRFSTQVKVPSGVAYTTAEIVESAVSGVCTFLFVCDQTKLTIPPPEGTTQFSPYLKIVLREDASNIRPGTKINSVLLEYLPDEFVDGTPYVGGPVLIGDCATGPVPPSPTLSQPFYQPCIAGRTYYKNKSVLGFTVDLDGDFEWTLVSFKNGSIAIRR